MPAHLSTQDTETQPPAQHAGWRGSLRGPAMHAGDRLGDGGRGDRFLRIAHSGLGWLLAASATTLASSGQIGYAVSADITDLRRFLVPAILEIAAIFLILGGYLRACDGDSPALLWLLASGVTAWATWTNLTHAGPRAGRVFAAATVLTFVLWLLKLRDRYRAARRASGLIDAPTAKFRTIRWLVQPRLTGRAWLLAIEYGIRDAELALHRSRLWHDTARHTRDDTSGTRWNRRRAAHRAAGLAVRQAHTSGYQQPRHASPPSEIGTAASTRQATDDAAPITSTPGDADLPTTQRTSVVRALGAGHSDRPGTAAEDNVCDGTRAPTRHETDKPQKRDRLTADPPTPSAATSYEPVTEEDATMYRTWLAGVAGGREPSGADLARSTGRTDDTSGIGRKAARRYRDCQTGHAARSSAAGAFGEQDRPAEPAERGNGNRYAAASRPRPPAPTA